jgi:hypothetical protein
MLAKHVAQVFFIPDSTNKRLKVVIPRKWWIVRVENPVDEKEFDQFDEIPTFITSMIKSRISSANEAPTCTTTSMKRLRILKNQDRNGKWQNDCVKYAQCVKIWPFVWKFDFHWIFVWNTLIVWKYDHLCENLASNGYLCEICSMCENMVVCVKILLSLAICVKYAQHVKIWLFVWKFYLHWVFVRNMLSVWKYGYLCENFTFVGYLCEIC